MFTIFRLLTGIAILVFVGFTVVNIKNRYVNHEDNPFQAPSASSVASGVFGGIKDYVASRRGDSASSGEGFFSARNGSSNETYRGGYLKSRPETTGKSMVETACDFYPDQCTKNGSSHQEQ